MSPEVVRNASGEISTFMIHILTRMNTSWQGTVDWLDGAAPIPFSSVLELLLLIDHRLFPH